MRRRSSWRSAMSDHLLPHTPAYREIWLDGERIAGGEEEVVEPIYGKTYLPRKFKIVVAVPPSNDVDVFAHDLGFIAIARRRRRHRRLERHGRRRHGHDPWRARHLSAHRRRDGLLPNRRRGGGRRGGRHRAARLGRPREPQARAAEIHDRGSRARRVPRRSRDAAPASRLAPARPFAFTSTGDRYGWSEGDDGRCHLTLFVENGRAARSRRLRSSCRRCAGSRKVHDGDFRLTPNQNLIVANVPTERQTRDRLRIAQEAGLLAPWSGLRRNAMACVALPTCGLALAESERYLPDLMTRAGRAARRARPVGRRHRHPHDRLPERLRAALSGRDRLGRQRARPLQSLSRRRLRRLAPEQALCRGPRSRRRSSPRSIPCSPPMRPARQKGERFGDFAIRAGFVAATGNGRDFHANVGRAPTVRRDARRGDGLCLNFRPSLAAMRGSMPEPSCIR